MSKMIKLLGSTLLIEPLPDADEQVSEGGIICVNRYKKTNLKFRVLAVGPGEFRKRLRKDASGRFKTTKQFDAPEVAVGDCILSRCELDADAVKFSYDDGSGRLIIRADAAMLVWRE
jgi:co-chaperonin GroES (HSP10)